MISELRFEQRIHAEPEAVYRMFTNSTAMREWLADRVLANPTQGGCLYLEWQTGYNAAGWFTALQPGHQVAFKVHGRGEPGPTEVDVHIEPDDGGSRVVLVHQQMGEGGEWEEARKKIQHGWEVAFERLVHSLEMGPDLRITTRPMLGVLFRAFNPEVAKTLNLPVNEGMLLDGTIEGMGAQKAGLQQNDLVVAINGHPITSFNDVSLGVQGKKAGDILQVVYYRGPEKRQADMTLSARPLPEIPTTVAGLAEALKQQYLREQSDLDSVLNDITEEEASFKSEENEWNVKEVLAHLIHGERGTQSFIDELFYDTERIGDGFGDNLHAYTKATAEVYGTATALREAFRASREETVSMIANLPETFANHKSTFWRLGYQLLAFPLHTHEHANQITAAIEKARAALPQ